MFEKDRPPDQDASRCLMPKRKLPERRPYDTDLTDVQWELIAPMIPDARAGGRPRKAIARGRRIATAALRPPLADGLLFSAALAGGRCVAADPSYARARRSRALWPASLLLGGILDSQSVRTARVGVRDPRLQLKVRSRAGRGSTTKE